MATLAEVVAFCDARTNRANVPDFPGACNGLQFENRGEVRRIGAAVDAGIVPFERAIERGIDFLIVHHGMFWDRLEPVTGAAYRKVRTLLSGDLAVYGAHLPLDLHPEIGNNVLLARKVGLHPVDTFLPYEGVDVGTIAAGPVSRDDLRGRLQEVFPGTFRAVEFGAEKIERVGVLTGSGQSAVPHLRGAGIDTLITGEVKQNAFNLAQELELNLYLCGHYRTETFGVSALAREASERFGLSWEFIETDCPL
jgi:dinuclear metal center YbgI/SA1388 family protein